MGRQLSLLCQFNDQPEVRCIFGVFGYGDHFGTHLRGGGE